MQENIFKHWFLKILCILNPGILSPNKTNTVIWKLLYEYVKILTNFSGRNKKVLVSINMVYDVIMLHLNEVMIVESSK